MHVLSMLIKKPFLAALHYSHRQNIHRPLTVVALRTCICERPSHLRSATHNQHPHNRSVKTWHIIASLFRTVGKRFFSITPVHLAVAPRSCELYGIWIPGHHFPKLRGGTFSAANFFANPGTICHIREAIFPRLGPPVSTLPSRENFTYFS